MEYDVLSKECDSGFFYNGVHYSTEGNVIKGYKNPKYALQIVANRLQRGENKILFQVTKGNTLYILNFRIDLKRALYHDVKIDASHYVIWESNYDLLMPLNRNLIYGNGLSFKIKENIKGATIYDHNSIQVKLKKPRNFDQQYFFGHLLVGVTNAKDPHFGQTVSVYRCYSIEYALESTCELLIETDECLSSTRLYSYKPLSTRAFVFRFVDPKFDRETHILYDYDKNMLTSFNV
jgi:hypothetical protein